MHVHVDIRTHNPRSLGYHLPQPVRDRDTAVSPPAPPADDHRHRVRLGAKRVRAARDAVRVLHWHPVPGEALQRRLHEHRQPGTPHRFRARWSTRYTPSQYPSFGYASFLFMKVFRLGFRFSPTTCACSISFRSPPRTRRKWKQSFCQPSMHEHMPNDLSLLRMRSFSPAYHSWHTALSTSGPRPRE